MDPFDGFVGGMGSILLTQSIRMGSRLLGAHSNNSPSTPCEHVVEPEVDLSNPKRHDMCVTQHTHTPGEGQ